MLGLANLFKTELLTHLLTFGPAFEIYLLDGTLEEYTYEEPAWYAGSTGNMAEGAATLEVINGVANYDTPFLQNESNIELTIHTPSMAKYISIVDLIDGSIVYIDKLVKPIDLALHGSTYIIPAGQFKIYI